MATRRKKFETEIESGLRAIELAGIAVVRRITEPAKVVKQGAGYVTVRTDNAPYDYMGHTLKGAVTIGAEAKETAEHKPSLTIRKPEQMVAGKIKKDKGSGIQWHQLDALATLHRAGGHAYILWRNGYKYGKLYGEDICEAYDACNRAWSGFDMPRGTWSIKWEKFTEFDYGLVGGSVALDWLDLEDRNVS